MDYVKYGVIGCGSAFRKLHGPGANKSGKYKFVSAYDVDERKVKRTAKQYKLEPFTDLNEFLKSDIDAVLIMVPHYLHEKMVVAVAEAGKHVLCEKPMATTLEACDNMIAVTKKARLKFMIAENHRFLPAHQYIYDAVQKGLIGDVFLIRAYEGVNEIPGLMKEGLWKGHPIKAGGGALMDMGAHKFATINWILDDEPESAYAWLTKQCTNLEEKAEDNALVQLKYRKGTIAEVVVSFTVISTPTNSIEVYGTKGTIVENHEWEKPVKIFSTHEGMGKYKGEWYVPNEIEHGPFPKYYEISMRCEDEYFAECILNDKTPEFTPNQAKNAVATVLLGYLSARKGSVAHYSELMDIYKQNGTKTILVGLEKFIERNY